MTNDRQYNKRQMNEANLLLKAYFEALYGRLEAKKKRLIIKVERLLREEIAKRGFENFDEQKFAAYRDACLAFIDERLESYNPIGIQYTFERVNAKEVFELELQLNWYDSRAEFEALIEAIHSKTQTPLTDEGLQRLADELISQRGAFPDASIICAYEADPALPKLPDYIVARAIEETIRSGH